MRRFLLENAGLKVLSLAVAFLLWAYVSMGQVLERRENLSLEFTGIPAGMSLAPQVKAQVRAVYSGRRATIRRLNPEEMRAVVAIPKSARAGEDIVVEPVVRDLPKGVTVEIPNVVVRLVPRAREEGT